MFTPRKKSPGQQDSPSYFGFLKSGLSKVTRRALPSTPSEGAEAPASPTSPIAAAPPQQNSPELHDFASPAQDLANSQQGTPDAHASRPSAVGGLQHGSVLAGADALQQDRSVTAHLEPDAALKPDSDMPASSDRALALSVAQTSWQVEAATILQQLPMPAKRPAEAEVDDACREFLAKRQRLGDSLQIKPLRQTPFNQLAWTDTSNSEPHAPLLLPAPADSPGAFPATSQLDTSSPVQHQQPGSGLPAQRQDTPMPSRFSASTASLQASPAQSLLRPSGKQPGLVASGRRQDTPIPSRFSDPAPSLQASPVQPPSFAFSRPATPLAAAPLQGSPVQAPLFGFSTSATPLAANPFSMGTSSRPGTPRWQHQKPGRSGWSAARPTRPAAPAANARPDVPRYPKSRLGRMPPPATQPPAFQNPWPKPASQASVPFGSPALLLQPRQNAAAATSSQQKLASQSASAGLSTQATEQRQHNPSRARRTPAPISLLSADQPNGADDPAQSPKPMDSAKAWTPMKASVDLSRQALQSKLTPGKQLPANSLIGAGLDPTTSGSTPRPHSVRRFTGMKSKRKADELEMFGPVQDEQSEEQGRRKQARTAEPEDLQLEQPTAVSRAPPPSAVLGFAPAPFTDLLHAPASSLPAEKTSDVADSAAEAAPAVKAGSDKAKAKDYGAPWAAAAAENEQAAPKPTSPSLLALAAPATTNAPSSSTAVHAREDLALPSSSSAPLPSSLFGTPKRSFFSDSLLGARAPAQSPSALQTPSTAPMAASPFTPAAQQASTPSSVLPTVQAPASVQPTPAQTPVVPTRQQPAPFQWSIGTGQGSALRFGGTDWPQQQASTAPNAATVKAPLANGPSKLANGKAQQASSSSSEGSGDTTEGLYPFPTQRSAQDRLEGIARPLSHSADEEISSLYVFGLTERSLADQNVSGASAAALSEAAVDRQPGTPSAASLQDGHLSPGEAQRLHRISSAVPLPSPGGSDSDSDRHMRITVLDTEDANGSSTSPEGDLSASNDERIATTESAGSQRSDADSGSDASAISGMSDVSSVAPTELQDAAEEVPAVTGQETSTSGWGAKFLQANQSAAQQAADAAPRQAFDHSAQSLQPAAAEKENVSQQPASDQPLQQSLLQKHQQQQEEEEARQPKAEATGHANAAAHAATSLLQAGVSDTNTGDAAALPAAKPMLPFAQAMQPTWPSNNAPSSALMRAIDTPLPDDAQEPAQTLPAEAQETADQGAAQSQAEGQKPRRMLKVRRKK